MDPFHLLRVPNVVIARFMMMMMACHRNQRIEAFACEWTRTDVFSNYDGLLSRIIRRDFVLQRFSVET